MRLTNSEADGPELDGEDIRSTAMGILDVASERYQQNRSCVDDRPMAHNPEIGSTRIWLRREVR